MKKGLQSQRASFYHGAKIRSHGDVPPGGALPNRSLERQQEPRHGTGVLGAEKGTGRAGQAEHPMLAEGITPRQTKFETNKEKLRQTIRAALSAATSFEDFSSLLLREGVTVKESRGRLSYLTPDRTRSITARKLGDDFDRAAVLAVLEQNAARAEIAAPKPGGVQGFVDIAAKKALKKGIPDYSCKEGKSL